MARLNFEQERPSILQLERHSDQLEQGADFLAHYKKLAARTLRSIHRHWLLVVSLVSVAVLLAFTVIQLMPRKYSATALILPSLYSQGQEKIVALASVDAASIVNGEARLVLSDAILQAVVRRLWPEQPAKAEQRMGWLRTMFFPEIRTESLLDRRTSMLRLKVAVVKDTRSYLISISFTASSADEAALVVNTVASEYLRAKSMQRRSAGVSAAEAELQSQRTVYGDLHPRVLQAVDALHDARAGLNALMADEGVRTDEGIKLALPNRTPTSPKGVVILGLFCMLGLLAGIALAIWRDRPVSSHSIRHSDGNCS